MYTFGEHWKDGSSYKWVTFLIISPVVLDEEKHTEKIKQEENTDQPLNNLKTNNNQCLQT